MTDPAPSAVLVITDTGKMSSLFNDEPSWKAMAIRADLREVDQLWFLDVNDQSISHVAFLNAEEPWVACEIKGKPTTYVPNIAMVDEMIEPIMVNTTGLNLPEANIEAVSIGDIDEILCSDDPLMNIICEQRDEYILNRRDFHFVAQLEYLKQEGLDMIALAEEFTEVSAGFDGPQMTALPTNWAKHWDQTEEQQTALLSLLNSAFASHMPVD